MRRIDADALMGRLEKKRSETGNQRYTEGFNDALMRFRSMIHSAPTIDAEPVRHGTWVYDSFTEYRCSNCNSPAPQYGYKKTYFAKTNYCPNCGKPMDGGGSNEG